MWLLRFRQTDTGWGRGDGKLEGKEVGLSHRRAKLSAALYRRLHCYCSFPLVLGKELVVCIILLPFTHFRVLMSSLCRWGGGREGGLHGLFPLCCLSHFYSHNLRSSHLSVLWHQRDTGIIYLYSWAPLHIKHDLTRSCHLIRPDQSILSLWASLLAQVVKNLPVIRETWVQSLGWEDPLEKGIPWTEEPGRLRSMWSQRVGDDWSTKHSTSLSMDTHFSTVHVRGTCSVSMGLKIKYILLVLGMISIDGN